MRLPCLRFTVRWMMVMVAFVAIAFKVEPMRRRWVYCQDQATAFGAQEVEVRKLIPLAEEVAFITKERGYSEIEVIEADRDAALVRAQVEKQAVHFRQMKHAYEQMAWRPWLPVSTPSASTNR
jgi:hypothetical protein